MYSLFRNVNNENILDYLKEVGMFYKMTDDLMPFSDLKPLTAKYMYQVWQKEWDESVIVPNDINSVTTKTTTTKIIKMRSELVL